MKIKERLCEYTLLARLGSVELMFYWIYYLFDGKGLELKVFQSSYIIQQAIMHYLPYATNMNVTLSLITIMLTISTYLSLREFL